VPNADGVTAAWLSRAIALLDALQVTLPGPAMAEAGNLTFDGGIDGTSTFSASDQTGRSK
jgi:hypothetical protein